MYLLCVCGLVAFEARNALGESYRPAAPNPPHTAFTPNIAPNVIRLCERSDRAPYPEFQCGTQSRHVGPP